MFVESEDDPRENGPSLGDERATLAEFLRCQRETLKLKCSGLSARDLALRSVEPSTLSLLGLVRHMADVERHWSSHWRRLLNLAVASSRIADRRTLPASSRKGWSMNSTDLGTL